MKQMLLLLSVSAVVTLLLASAATAQHFTGGKGSKPGHTATATAKEATSQPNQPCSPSKKASKPSRASSFTPVALIMVDEQPCYYYLRRTGGASLVALFGLGALVVVGGSSMVVRSVVRRYTSL